MVDSVKVATSGDADGDVWGAVKQVGSVAGRPFVEGLPPGSLGRDVARLARCPATIVWRFTLALAVVLRVTLAVVVIRVVVAIADFRGRFVFVAVFPSFFFVLLASCCCVISGGSSREGGGWLLLSTAAIDLKSGFVMVNFVELVTLFR